MQWPTLTLTQGLPGSGKTTWAKARAAYIGAVRIERDEVKRRLWGRWRGEWWAEAVVSAITYPWAVAVLLIARRSVIISDTNLDPRVTARWGRIARWALATCDIYDLTRVPLQDCIDRQAEREGERVPEAVIRAMHDRWLAA